MSKFETLLDTFKTQYYLLANSENQKRTKQLSNFRNRIATENFNRPIGYYTDRFVTIYLKSLYRLRRETLRLLADSLVNYKQPKLNKNQKEKISEIIKGNLSGLFRSGEQNLNEFIASLGHIPIGSIISAKVKYNSGLSIASTYFTSSIEVTIKNYNLNPQNWWGKNKDYLIFNLIDMSIKTIPKVVDKLL